MRNPPLNLSLGLASLLAVSCTSLNPAPHSPEAQLAQQNQLFEEYYEARLKRNPESATAYGDFRYNDKLDDYSLAGARAEHDSDVSFAKRLAAISTQGFPEQDELSHQVLARALSQAEANYSFKEYEMPVNQMNGPHQRFADLPLSMPFDSVKHYEDYIARLKQIPRALQDTEAVLRQGVKDNLMPVKFLLEKVPAQCEMIISANPFLLPIKKMPAEFSASDRERLSTAITKVVNEAVLPAYHDFGQFIAADYAPHGRAVLSVTSLPGGNARYLNNIKSRTTITNLSPQQIHDIGLKEIDRIQAEMLAIARKEGFADLDAFRASLKTNPKYLPTSAEQILDDFRKYIAQMQPKLPELFGYLPGSPVTVEAIPDFQAASATHYSTGTPDGKRPGRVVVATSHYQDRSLINDEAVAYHEGIPGHHMQQSVAQQMTTLPKFRLHIGNSGYIEGWALYAEELGKEVGFYQDPVSDYGRLSSELFRAVRLVVDTGIHDLGWSRDDVVAFFRKYQAVDEPTIQSETDRYIAWPGQALSYKLGQLKIRELRERARSELGTRFDIRAFHDEMLNGGVLPLDLLESRTASWIREQKSGAKAAN